MAIQDGEEVAMELLKSLKEDTSKVSALEGDKLYSLQMGDGKSLIANSTFESMKLKADLISELYKLGFEKPSIIQNLAIPHIIKGKDSAFQSKSGTGKTVAFAVGALQSVEVGKEQQVIILSPTRELSIQVGKVVEKIAESLKIKVCYALGDFSETSIAAEIIVGCPGKIISLINSKVINANSIKMIIFDEADELISNQAFSAQTLKLLKSFENVQKVFFSATYSDLSQKALAKLAPNAEKFLEKNEKADKIQLYYLDVPKNKKLFALKSIFEYLTVAQTIIFVATKNSVDFIAGELEKDGFSVSKIHGNLTPLERDSANKNFIEAKTKILVSTNVFSRGMDIPQVNLIINYDIPNFSSVEDLQTYIHRIGRSGRFNRSGFVIDFVSGEEDLNALASIQSGMNAVSKKFTLEGLQRAFFDSSDF